MADNLIDVSERAGVRYLHFSSDWVQGAMRVQRPNALELPYTREMMAGLLLREPPWPRHALLVGLGPGSLAKFIYHQLPATKITVVEIDPQVEIVARLHFNLPDDPLRLRVLIGDGAEHMLAGGNSYDYILVDGFDKRARAGVLDTLPFYQACRSRLSDGGLLAVNLLGRERGFLPFQKGIVVAGPIKQSPAVDFKNPVRQFPQEHSVVRNEQQRSVPTTKKLFEPANRFNVQVVGWFVKQQQVGTRNQ